jgi:hypothetical protein
MPPWIGHCLVNAHRKGARPLPEDASTGKEKEPVLETVAVVNASKVDKLEFRQPTDQGDPLSSTHVSVPERSVRSWMSDAQLLRWALQVFDALDVGQKGFATGADLASELKKLPPTNSPKLAPVRCSCHPTRVWTPTLR